MTPQQNPRTAWRVAKGMCVRRRGEAAKTVLTSPGAAKKKRRRGVPLGMTPKAQRRRWLREHNRRARAAALRKTREEGDSPSGSGAP